MSRRDVQLQQMREQQLVETTSRIYASTVQRYYLRQAYQRKISSMCFLKSWAKQRIFQKVIST
ncbi:hypothetical protein L0P73_18100 [[Clostridium] innocuum]|uniref:hypothetical protein n=1 Tax=Clostridium innocuum TaxID=1522 RepID=UPI001EDFEF37|nr:hypothetical protein [[Clostridium] innocuum]MCG4662494.1 hypothetical protein [[Clostridium] innocuum]